MDAGSLYPHQRDGVAKLVRLRGRALLWDEPGLGKTIQTIAAILELDALPAVVVCPPTMALTWRDEWRQWAPEVERVTVVKDGKTAIAGDIVILSYAMATKRVAELRAFAPRMVVFDEAQALRNVQAKQTRALLPFGYRAPMCLQLTGTPMFNRPMELWTQLKMARVPIAGGRFEFGLNYCDGKQVVIGSRKVIDPKTGEERLELKKRWDFSGASNIESLQRMMAPYVVRRKLATVMKDLPEFRRVKMLVDGCGGDELLGQVIQGALEDVDGDAEEAFRSLREVPFGAEQSVMLAYRELGESKVEAAKEWVETNVSAETPAVVFAHHLDVLDELSEHAADLGLRAKKLVGDTPPAARHDMVERFQAGEIDVLFCGITAANAGITLTRASQILVVELPWTPMVMRQIEGRCLRIGQTRGVVARYLVAEGTADERIWEMLESKVETISKAIDGEVAAFEADEVQGGRWELIRRLVDAEAAKWTSTRTQCG